MNPEICKRCPNVFYLVENFKIDNKTGGVVFNFSGTCIDKNENEIFAYEFPPEYEKIIEDSKFMKSIKCCYELPFFDELEPDKRCPYFMEHKLVEWNDK